MAGHAYIGSFTSAGGRGITTAAVDPDTGALAALHHTDAVPDPSFLTLSEDRRRLYTVSETAPDGGAAAFALNGSDAPRQLGATEPVRGGAPTHLCLHKDHLLTANYATGDVSVLQVAADGGPGTVRSVLAPARRSGPHAHMVLPDPSGRWVLTVDIGTDSVRVCALDPASGALETGHELLLRPGSGPRHLTFHPRGDRAYVMHEYESIVTVCHWDAGEGGLRAVAEAPVLPTEAEPPGGANYPSELVVAPDGRFVWAANRGRNSIAVLTLDGTGDLAELRETVPCGGDWPRHLTLDPSGRRLYAANERSGDVTWFDIDPDSGTPRMAGSMEVPAAACVVFS